MTLSITTYLRTDLLFESYAKVLNDDRIKEIVIVDDHSPEHIFRKIQAETEKHDKIKLYRNGLNLGMLNNKRRAIELASHSWVIIFDSDNVMDSRYLDAIWNDDTVFHKTNEIYCPSFAEPEFDYRKYEGLTVTKDTAKHYMDDRMFRCSLNTSNFLVHKDTFLDSWTANGEVKGSDTIWMNYKWLQGGGSLYFVPGMYYFHRKHNGSGWLADADHNIRQAKKIEKLISEL
jgi:glycosyltransferase involved in cell wall biosynthesis